MTDFISPVCRLVQGQPGLQVKKNQKTGLPEKDEQGNVIMESFIAVAIRKDDPQLMPFYNLFAQTAQTFRYLRDRVESGELVLPDGSLQTGQFGQQAIHGVVNGGRVS